MVFPVVVYGCESWTLKKAESQRIDAFELWCWRRLWRVPWTARRFNQSILEEISPLIISPPDAKSWLIWKDPDAEKDYRQEEKGMTEDEMVDGITNSMDMGLVDSGSWWWTGKPSVLQLMGSQRAGHDWVPELNWTFNYVHSLIKY